MIAGATKELGGGLAHGIRQIVVGGGFGARSHVKVALADGEGGGGEGLGMDCFGKSEIRSKKYETN